MYGVNIDVTNFTVLMYRYGDGKNNATPKIFLPSTVTHKIKVRRRHRVSPSSNSQKFPFLALEEDAYSTASEQGGEVAAVKGCIGFVLDY